MARDNPAPAAGPFTAHFKTLALELDQFNERRERLVKASRDVTQLSKKLIFQLHRATPSTRAAVVSAGAESAARIRAVLATRVGPEVTSEDVARLRRAFSPGVQEYIEARTFLGYMQDGRLVGLADVRAEVHKGDLMVSEEDYVLGLADLTGELMRVGVAGGEVAKGVLAFLREMQKGMERVEEGGGGGREMRIKMRVLRQSVAKVERACFERVVRRAEFGDPVEPDRKRARVT